MKQMLAQSILFGGGVYEADLAPHTALRHLRDAQGANCD